MIPAPDGYQYGVRCGDGSVIAPWNGRTQRQHAEALAKRLNVEYAPDVYLVVRRLPPDGAWEVVWPGD